MIPGHRRFDAAGFVELERLAEESLPVGDHAAREQESQAQKARLDLDLVGRVAAGQRLRIDASCWPEGRAAVRVSSYHSGRVISSERVLRDWPWVSIPVADGASDDERARAMSAELEALFPWARLTIERERYREESYPLFIAQRACWDPEFADYDWGEDDGDFDAWFAERFDGEVVPFGVQLPSGIMRWRLSVELNSVGEQALEASNDEDFVDAMSSIELEDALAESRADGVYRADVVEGRVHSYVTVVFDSEQTGRLEALYMAPDPDSDPGDHANPKSNASICPGGGRGTAGHLGP